MGKSDTFSKDLLQNNTYFADTINNGLFGGKQIVIESELEELDTTESAVIEDEIKNIITIQKSRDILKSAMIRKDQTAIYVIFGIENQTDIHYAMPVRTFLYDALRYAKQVESKRKKHKGEKLTSSEFLSGWTKDDKLIPVITLTVYFGEEDWDGALTLHEMFEENVDPEILKLIPDYKAHLLNPHRINNWDNFKSDIGILFRAIAASNQEGGITKIIEDNPEDYQQVDNQIVKALNFYTQVNYSINNEKSSGVMSSEEK